MEHRVGEREPRLEHHRERRAGIGLAVTVDYPFNFIVLGPVARLVTPQTTLGDALTMRAQAVMRNENQ
jgi:hypothetical protein